MDPEGLAEQHTDNSESIETKDVTETRSKGPVGWFFERPALIWVFFLYFLYSTVFDLSRHYGNWAGNFGPEKQAHYLNFTWVDWTATCLLAGVTLAGTVSLVLLKRVAATLFVSVLCINILILGYQLLLGAGTGIAGTNLTSLVMGFGIYVLICIYSLSLRLTGVLK